MKQLIPRGKLAASHNKVYAYAYGVLTLILK
jgi:hypothetical protein